MYESQFSSNINIALKLAWKSKIHITMSYFVVILLVVVLLVAEFSARQLATVSLDMGISIIKLSLPFIVVLLAQELFSREFDKKLNLTSLTYPCSRATWLLARSFTIFLISFSLLIIMAVILAFLTTYAGETYQQATPVSLGIPYLITLFFIGLDLLVVVAVSTLLAVSSVTTSFVLIGTFGFIFIARSYTPIIELLKSNPYAVSDYVDPELYKDSLSAISFILPDLGRLDVRMIAMYDKMEFLPDEWMLLVASVLAYVVATFALSVWVLNKRELNQ